MLDGPETGRQGRSRGGDGRPVSDPAHTQREHELDRQALDEALPPGGGNAGAVAPSEQVPPPRRPPRRRRTRVLLIVIAAGIVFLAGMQLGKLTAGLAPPAGQPGAATSATGATGTVPEPPAGGAQLTFGEVEAVRGDTLYVREPSGLTVRVQANPGARVERGRPVALGDVRPGELVAAQVRRAPDGRLAASSITVLPASRER